MRRSEFDRAVDDEFGPQGRVLVDDLILPPWQMTAREALRLGEPPRAVWLALCAEADVPDARRHGVGRREPKR